VGFTDADSTPDKERIMSKSRVFDDALGGGVGVVIGVTDDKVVEGVLRMKVGGVGGSGRSEGKKRRRVFGGIGRRRKRGLKNKLELVFGFGLIVEGISEKLEVAFVVDVN